MKKIYKTLILNLFFVFILEVLITFSSMAGCVDEKGGCAAESMADRTLITPSAYGPGNVKTREQVMELVSLGEELKELGRYDEAVDKSKFARLYSLTSGELGSSFEGYGLTYKAIRFTEEAILAAQSITAHDLLIKWEWQLGRLFSKKGFTERAISAYRRAIWHIESVRMDIPIVYKDGKSSFRSTLAPVYTGLADMLLKKAATSTDNTTKQILLKEARETVEQIKRSELQDYFRDRCVASRASELQTLYDSIAVIYPVILEDRLEVLVDIGGTLYQKSSPVGRDELEKTSLNFSLALRSSGFYEDYSSKLYDWIIGPVMPVLKKEGVNTLIFIPDGSLRLFPPGALNDGEKFLIESYALAVSPGLTLLDSSPLATHELSALIAGMSEAGDVVFDLPDNLWKALSLRKNSDASRELRSLTVEMDSDFSSNESTTKGESADRHKEADIVRSNLALPGVKKEVDNLSRMLDGKTVLDQEFRIETFENEMRENRYGIVHIASHGYFGGSPENNFIMTYDKLLNMNRLESVIKPRKFDERPVEIISLSACQTAEGDDRSPLGLTGVALKSGSRSAMGSLWPVSDSAAQILLPEFYTALIKDNLSKAEALRQAQIKLMKTKGFEHPFYWSPFILVGNWL